MKVMTAHEIAERLPYNILIDRLAAHLADGCIAPPRHYHHMTDNDDFILLMPAWSRRWIGVKVSGIFPGNPARGADGVAETYLLMDRISGRTAAVLDGLELTNRRTAAASALAARALARTDARSLLVMGTGSLAAAMVLAHCTVRCYDRIMIWGRNPEKAGAIVTCLAAEGIAAEIAVNAEAAVRSADVVSCVTGASSPVVSGAWLQPGTHLDLVGAHTPKTREADSDAVAKAIIYADVRDNVLREAGDILIPIGEGRITAATICGELVDLAHALPGTLRKPDDITLFKSVGFAVEDLIAAIAATQGQV